ncbi:hypothetical protein Pint_25721 [Pistacia integerrima]|uniref:Uncharacterized protein n=1 Tax=Pistacia integerrima TaxID=434235 RepID=A0ACC0YAZ8_9ROSI|nr:hypothetical protein Pint_25721 [Pistacia integerrima]
MLSIRSILTSQRNLRPSKLFPFHSSCLCYSAAAVEAERTIREGPRHDWSKDEIKSIYDSPVLDLLFHGAQVHRHAHNFREVQQCTLLSIKTGGCSEDCSYCPQSSRYDTGVKAQKLMAKETVMQAAQKGTLLVVGAGGTCGFVGECSGIMFFLLVVSCGGVVLFKEEGGKAWRLLDFLFLECLQQMGACWCGCEIVSCGLSEVAKEAGSTRFCMGAAWRDTIGRKTNFNNILEYVKEIR